MDSREIVERALAAFNARDADGFAALVHQEFLFVPLLTRPAQGTAYRGRAGARQYVADAHRWADTRLDLRSFDARDDIIISRCVLHIAVGGRTASTDAVYVARLRDGLVAEMATLADVEVIAHELGLSPPEAPPLELSLPAVPASVPSIRAAVRAFVETRGLDEPEAVALAVSEAATNVVLHAYRDRDHPGPVHVRATDVPDGVLVSVADEGLGLRPRPDSPGVGLGLALMQHHAAELSLVGPPQRSAGTEVRLRFLR